MFTHRTRTIVSTLTLSLALAGIVACKSEVDEKPKAKVEEAGKAEAKPEAKPGDAGEATTLALATEGTKINFIGAKVTADHKGEFSKFAGTATVDGDKITAMEITVEMSSLTTDNEKLTGHLLSADFFEADKYPEAKFTTLSITEKPGDDGATHEVEGNLQLKDQTKKVTFPATLHVKDGSVHGKAAFSIDRKQWGIVYAGMPDDLIKDDVALELELSFPKA